MPIHQPNRPSGITVCFWMAAAASIYALMILITLARLQEMSGGIPVFDMMPTGYDSQFAHSLLTAIGGEGRQYYLWRQIPLDLIYPALFGTSFYLLANWMAGKLHVFQRILRLTALVAVAVGVADYIENFFIILMLRDYPNLSDALVNAASIATLLKSSLTLIYFIVLIVVLLAWAIQFIFRLRAPTAG
ncbi:MAG: hypothetical protein COA52_06895 [Hyphomicrobiales bacterium]|nr:MAG: hypothetical protein COA52_06895 [Hyphomicrobiales bacterium]